MAPASVSAVLRGWLRSGEVGFSEVTTTIHFCVSRVSRGADWLELSVSTSSPETERKRQRQRQRKSASRAGFAPIDGAKFAAGNGSADRDGNTGYGATSGVANANPRSGSAAQDSRRYSPL